MAGTNVSMPENEEGAATSSAGVSVDGVLGVAPKRRSRKMYTQAHEESYQSGLKEIDRYDEKFRPIVEAARDEALGWDTAQRRQANVDRATTSARFGLRKLHQAAGADVGDIIRSGTATGDIMAGTSVQGDQVTGWQKLKKLGNVTATARHQKGVVDQGMMSYGNMTAESNRAKAAIDSYLKDMRSQQIGQVVGLAAGMAAGGWWNDGGASHTYNTPNNTPVPSNGAGMGATSPGMAGGAYNFALP